MMLFSQMSTNVQPRITAAKISVSTTLDLIIAPASPASNYRQTSKGAKVGLVEPL